MSYRVVHYINQFFANIGGEEMAHIAPELREGKVGPGLAFETAWKGEAVIVNTIICGDSYFAEHEKEAKEQVLNWVKEIKPDLFIAGPAFNAGRYGYACANIALEVQTELGIPVLTGMYKENPGADMKDKILVVETANSAAGMRKAAPTMAKLGMKLMKGEELGASIEEGYLPNGIRKNFFEKERGAKRAVKMLLAKLNDQPFVTEFPMPDFDRVEPGKAIADMSKAVVALCTSGGTVPKGNPDHIESSSASHYGEYDIEGIETLTADAWETAHGGYDPVYANDEPNRVLPVDVLRQMEKEGKIGKLHRYFYTTVGNGTAVASSKKFAAEYAQKLLKAGVHAVIMTST
jgi:glycine reductase